MDYNGLSTDALTLTNYHNKLPYSFFSDSRINIGT